jgi:hypothetical protein
MVCIRAASATRLASVRLTLRSAYCCAISAACAAAPRFEPAFSAYTAGMNSIQYTVRGVPPDLDAELRREARTSGKTLNALVVETLEHAKLPSPTAIHDDLDWFVGSATGGEGDAGAAQAWLDALPLDELA